MRILIGALPFFSGVDGGTRQLVVRQIDRLDVKLLQDWSQDAQLLVGDFRVGYREIFDVVAARQCLQQRLERFVVQLAVIQTQ